MTDELSPAARLDEEEHHRAELEAARVKAEAAARTAPPPRIVKATPRRHKAATEKEALADLLGKVIAHERKLHGEQIANLERRIQQLEARPTLAPRGVWKPKASYSEGDCVTDKGALWTCVSAVTGARPGASHCWRLSVKSGAAR
jgi:hypothetical protein